MSITLSPDEERFKEAYIRSRGYWVEFNDGLLRHNPRWLRAHLAYADTIQEEGPLGERIRELIFVAVDASTTHLYTRGLEIHIRKALAANCSAADLIEVLLISAVQGLDSVVAGVAILAEEAGRDFEGDGEIATALLDRYASIFGDRPDWLSHVALLAPGYARALIDLAEIAEADAGLTPRERTLVRLALAASPTHLNREAMRTETRHALDAGASPAEILEVFQLVGLLGMHACVDGIPAVIAAAGKG
ncbi:carboxymuconolactone decarboxylase family protein [Sphingopyxis sp. JAI128]|uniref:carboxymuconolactone decarboxylase family protein n=1 Tax=Sphingopyxis sp. JAI128 TaxID=2723066 RepID=UPI001618AADA|nr:carboxymuconolactone decarboxylase family protein [Sphingopyxis sp. JAI128]MBB6427883.1 alkylhydroperoxidase/carboxymuconolactone decarboxylase family protein YurZ [Sphingopyxis sp. JAI128]